MRHVDIGSLAASLARPLLLSLGLIRRLLDLEGIFARWLLADVDELAVHVLDAGDRNPMPHGGEFGLDVRVQRCVVCPDKAWGVILLGTDDEDLVLLLERGERFLAVGPSVLEVLDRHAGCVRLALQVRQQRRAVLDTLNHGTICIRARLPRLFAQRPIWSPVDAWVASQPFGQLPLMFLRVTL